MTKLLLLNLLLCFNTYSNSIDFSKLDQRTGILFNTSRADNSFDISNDGDCQVFEDESMFGSQIINIDFRKSVKMVLPFDLTHKELIQTKVSNGVAFSKTTTQSMKVCKYSEQNILYGKELIVRKTSVTIKYKARCRSKDTITYREVVFTCVLD